MQSKLLAVILAVQLVLSSCAPMETQVSQTDNPAEPAPTDLMSEAALPTQTNELSSEEPSVSFSNLTFWFDPAVPLYLRESVGIVQLAADEDSADIRMEKTDQGGEGVQWIYALTAPFSSLLDSMTIENLKAAWQGADNNIYTIYLAESTLAALEGILGAPGASVATLPSDDFLAAAWNQENALAIVPFEELEPRWKVLSIDGQSPVHNDFRPENYPLTASFDWYGEPEVLEVLAQAVVNGEFPQITGNRDPSKMTVLVMTGVTALVRATAVKMEEKGMTYPGEDIHDWLVNADLTHISNEVSFSPVCPDPKPDPMPLVFCSKTEYIELLDYVGTDILELTGNHGVDWGRDALIYSLDLYQDRGWYVYAAGENIEQAREAVKVEHNGNKLAFIGCNPAGPEYIWATETQPGVADCDYPWMWQRIRQLTDEGYLVISTFQYFEAYRHYVEPFEEKDFRSMADAGAVIVSGSQSHHPMAMEFYNGSFIHYGLGNLFFDQMHTGGLIPDGTRKEFIDRYVFYNNRYISTEILTAMLEDYARPRPMTPAERYDFLTEIFAVTDWGDVP